MPRTVALILVVLAAAALAGGIFWWRSQSHEKRAADAAAKQDSAVPANTTEAPSLSPEGERATVKQEQEERAQLELIATELGLERPQTDRLAAILGEMQKGRVELFAKLAARTVAVEEVSAKLRDLREAMHASIATEVGEDRAKEIRERMRVAHGGEPAP